MRISGPEVNAVPFSRVGEALEVVPGLIVTQHSGEGKAFTRNGLDWTKRFSTIAGALDMPGEAIFDGEVVVVKDGRTNFSELQAELAAGRQDRLVYYVFDLLYLDGLDLRDSPQIERKRVLKAVLEEQAVEVPVLYSEHLIGDGQEMFAHAAKLVVSVTRSMVSRSLT
jgi:bifunctional non-homologous end joining protein LigD